MKQTGSTSDFTTAEEELPGAPLIGALLRMPGVTVRDRILARLHEHGYADLEPAHLTVFQYPGPQGLRPTDLAARLRMSKQALNYLLGELERLGYVERRPDTKDRRGKRVTLTARGVATIAVIRQAVDEVEADWAKQLGATRFAQLRTLLVELNAMTDSPSDRPGS